MFREVWRVTCIRTDGSLNSQKFDNPVAARRAFDFLVDKVAEVKEVRAYLNGHEIGAWVAPEEAQHAKA